jgi:hypothetical protein
MGILPFHFTGEFSWMEQKITHQRNKIITLKTKAVDRQVEGLS